ncbi:hypothetical protein [Phormidesmis priestleyi]
MGCTAIAIVLQFWCVEQIVFEVLAGAAEEAIEVDAIAISGIIELPVE